MERWSVISKGFSLIVCAALVGCASIPPFGVHRSPEIAQQVDPLEVSQLSPGSQVNVTCRHLSDNIVGTVLQASPEGIVMVNGTYVTRDPQGIPISQRQLPCHWVCIQRIAKVEVTAPPPAGFVGPSIEINTADKEELFGDQIGLEYDSNGKLVQTGGHRSKMNEIKAD